MRSATSLLALCVSMFLVLNHVKEVKTQDVVSICKFFNQYAGTCGANGNQLCQGQMATREIRRYARCDCNNIRWRKKDYHECRCYSRLPCNE
ncbi:hypothetical protein ARALYDRAFT_898907 [Arabidopsis lyrata subsp. lyrata]|uniref:Uncharacterized protein n=1 Tax=Arabidopsis lyrata subsp. lyrata TaxID=81972 RepID=D7L3G7_ARALL|nr:hypothetical protein ARALYDRAFT_898907 [Arabidopsis lyrata subsp. lyrata]